MNSRQFKDPQALVEAYLDGLLSEADSRAFEARLAADAGLRGEVEKQRRIDAALRRMYEPGVAEHAAAAVLQRAGQTSRPRVKPQAPARRVLVVARYAAAAMIVLAASGGSVWWLHHVLTQLDAPDRYAVRSVEQVFNDEVNAGFTPSWVCSDDREFADTFWREYGQAVVVAAIPRDATVWGLSYANCISPRTTTLLAKLGDGPHMVFIDLASRDSSPSVPPRSGLHLFRRVLGRLVLYELSPRDKPSLLELFREAPPPEHDAPDDSNAISTTEPCR